MILVIVMEMQCVDNDIGGRNGDAVCTVILVIVMELQCVDSDIGDRNGDAVCRQ